MKTEEILKKINIDSIEDLQGTIYKLTEGKGYIANAYEVIHAIEIIDKLGYRIEKK